MRKIVDVSNNNGRVDFHAVKAAGAVGVWLKVTEGTGFADPTYEANHKAAKAAGLRVGGYHFGHPKDGSPAEAEFFLSHLKLERGDLLPILDLEETDGVSTATVHAYAAGFLAAVSHKIGERAGLYCGSYFIRANGLTKLRGPRWIPSYGSPPAFYSWDAWQFTDGETKYPGSICRLDTSHVRSLALVTYKARRTKKVVGHAKKAVYIVRDGLVLLVGSREWRFWKRWV